MPIGVYPRKPNRKYELAYNSWRAMHERCSNPKYKRYNGRGIKVCARWSKYANFKEDMGERPSRKHQIDRINNDGDYCPENCRWATPAEQARNNSRKCLVEYQGKTYCIADLSILVKIHVQTLYSRFYQGWNPEEIVSQTYHTLTLNGVTKTWGQWSKDLSIPYNTILKRVKSGKPVEVVLENGIPRSKSGIPLEVS